MSSEKDYILTTSPLPSKTVLLKTVAIGALVGGLLLALALSITALTTTALSTNQQQIGIGGGSDDLLYERVTKVSSTPISAKVCCVAQKSGIILLCCIIMNRCSRHLASMSLTVTCLMVPT